MRATNPKFIQVMSNIIGETYNPFTMKLEQIVSYTLQNSNQLKVEVMSLGAKITSIKYPDREGNIDDVVLGFDDIEPYQEPAMRPFYMSGIVGRTCGRLKDGLVNLDSEPVLLTRNLKNKHHLHGGKMGFDVSNWSVHCLLKNGVKFWLQSPDLHEGYPGNMLASASFTLNDDNVLSVMLHAKTDKPTACDLSNHIYFNLAGHSAGKDALKRHLLEIQSCMLLKTDEDNLPTGMYQRVNETPFDFRTPSPIGKHLFSLESSPTGGYEHYFYDYNKSIVAQVLEPRSKRYMVLMANQPGLTFETANNFPDISKGEFGIIGKHNGVYSKHSAFALSTHNFPDSLNQEEFPSCELQPEQIYFHQMHYRFGVYDRD